ncbi:MAG: double-strand break repair helicase AddA [Xanthobacteraceae bacterium]
MNSSARVIPDTVTERQHAASDPAASAWVSANAGSGKTYVLAQRVIRLLLDGTDPAKILCLTYTKAAAANMANRVFERLARWATLDDDTLGNEIRRTDVKRVDAKRLAQARRLFAQALETPGGLKVQTIHAFCTRLLQQFPFEADVAARFQVLEETQQKQMLEDIRAGVLLTASANPDSVEGRALKTIIELTTDFAFQTALAETIVERDRVTAWLDRAGSIGNATAELSRSLGIGVEETVERVDEEIVNGPIFPIGAWAEAAAICKASSSRDQEQCERLTDAAQASGSERIKKYFEVFIDTDPKPRTNVITKALAKKSPMLAQTLLDEQTRVVALRARRLAVIARTRTGALMTLANAVIARYRTEKEARGLLDYDDLIAKTRDLLTRVGAAWVHYKLDLGIDHLLIDEAQDTSPEQWDIVRRLVTEFAAGAGARGTLRRTIFAVGDDKQSIFSFQGAVPREFDEMHRSFKKTFESAGANWLPVRLEHSFRSNDSVLTAVEHVFREHAVYRSVTSDADGISRHVALDDAAPGFVEIWPLVEPEKREPVPAWDSPFDRTSETSPRVKLARRIAKCVRLWIDRKERVGTGAERHAVRPGDILVLVRQRGPLFEAVIRALKNEDIAVAGADRLVLTDHIAVMDLLALADAMLLPRDDLALAAVLKSPLFGVTEDELFALAWDRKGTLRAALRERQPELAARLDDIARDARRLTPFAFYANLLGANRGRKHILARLGHEANDVIDEFLNLALAYEGRETPSLQGFVAWLRTASAEIKRDMEVARNEVRVMTVHGAKGLEAPIVILADTTTQPEGPAHLQPRLLPLPAQPAAPDTPDRLVWMPTKKEDIAPTANARLGVVADAVDEYRRLLYVAMTRAADRLVVCGSVGQNKRPEGCWYDLIAGALKDHCVEEPADDGAGTVKRYRKSEARPEQLSLEPPTAAGETHERPDWLTRDAPEEVAPLAPLAPSQAHDETAPITRAGGAARKTALARGVVMHRLLQSLPEIPPERRAEAARQYLARKSAEFTAEECQNMAAQALAVTEDPRFLELFRPGSRAEVSIVGRVEHGGRKHAVSGVVDRLAVTENAVLIADYKTNRPPPRRLDEVPQPYLAQLALYRAVLAQLYPGKAVRAALVWTEVPDLMELSAADLDGALASYMAARQP